jgi:hypothetical protein
VLTLPGIGRRLSFPVIFSTEANEQFKDKNDERNGDTGTKNGERTAQIGQTDALATFRIFAAYFRQRKEIVVPFVNETNFSQTNRPVNKRNERNEPLVCINLNLLSVYVISVGTVLGQDDGCE